MPRPNIWHPSVFLEDFVKQVNSLQQLIDMTRTPKLGSFDGDTVKRSMGWGLYVEQVRIPREAAHGLFCSFDLKQSYSFWCDKQNG